MKRTLLVLWCCACETPPGFATADLNQQNPTGRIEGQVVMQGPSRGDVILFLYDAHDPPPPTGTGAPLTFSVVSQRKLFGSADGSGPFSAPFAFSLVKPGNYLI